LILWTIGHSTRSAAAFLAVLRAHEVEAVIDVRRYPASRRLPQFNEAALSDALGAAGLAYRWIPALGGRRRAAPDSPNTGWRHAAFRGYADHVSTAEFADGLVELLMIAGGLRAAVMCAEILWWQCHRRLIADVLVSLGHEVLHIATEQKAEPHRLIDPARIVDGELSYAAQQQALFL
jgi:uncharacterized protein (DUF488 family)